MAANSRRAANKLCNGRNVTRRTTPSALKRDGERARSAVLTSADSQHTVQSLMIL